MQTVDEFKDRIGEQFYLLYKKWGGMNYIGTDVPLSMSQLPFTLIKIKDGYLWLIKKAGTWSHREDIDNERLKHLSLVKHIPNGNK